MKRLCLAIALSACSIAWGSDNSCAWEQVSEQTIDADNPEDIRNAINGLGHHDIFKLAAFAFKAEREIFVNSQMVGLENPTLISIKIKGIKFEFQGKSSCKAGDPRLTRHGGTADLSYSDGSRVSWGTATTCGDPCSDSAYPGTFKPERKISKM